MKKCALFVVMIMVLLSIGCGTKSPDNIINDSVNHNYDEESRIVASKFASGRIDGGGGGRGGIAYSAGRGCSFEDLAETIFIAKSEYNKPFSVDDPHKRESNIEDWYLCLKDTIENDDNYLLQDEPFTETFEKTYGSLPDRDGDSTPDCIDADPDDPDKDAYLTTESAIELLNP